MKDNNIHKFFECLVPVSACNLKCDYCYVIQEGRDKGKIVPFKYTVEQMRKVFSQERIGGSCYFSLCGAGETMFHPELPNLVATLLEEGHYVNITTNGTYTKGYQSLFEVVTNPKHRERMLFSFSMHWLELNRKNQLDTFKQNVLYVKSLGCSILVQLNLYDGYIPYLDEIREFCLENFGALPQLAVTRKEGSTFELHTSLTSDEYAQIGRQFDSPLFEFTLRNFNVPNKKYCYAGAWSYVLDLGTGKGKSCYKEGPEWNIIDYVDKPIPSRAVACHCSSAYCINSSHFISLGVVPDIYQDTTYASLRNRNTSRGGWLGPVMESALEGKLRNSNSAFSAISKFVNECKYYKYRISRFVKNKIRGLL